MRCICVRGLNQRRRSSAQHLSPDQGLTRSKPEMYAALLVASTSGLIYALTQSLLARVPSTCSDPQFALSASGLYIVYRGDWD